MDVIVLLTLIGTSAAIIGSNIALISWLRTDMKSFEIEVRGWREESHKESKEFYAKLERQDAEFKSHMMYCHISGEKQP